MNNIFCIDPVYWSFHERKLSDNQYRYNGYYHTIHYCIDSNIQKSESEIEDFLDERPTDFLINNGQYVITLK